MRYLIKFSPASMYSSHHCALNITASSNNIVQVVKFLDYFDHIISKFYLLHFLFIIVETFRTSTFIILHFCQGTTNSQTSFMYPGLACYAFNCISFYSFVTYATWTSLANWTFCSLYPNFHSFQTSAFQTFFPSGIF